MKLPSARLAVAVALCIRGPGLFLLMAIAFPAVMNSLDGAPHAASITLSHRRGMEIGPGGGSIGGAHMPTPSVDAYGHRDQSTYTYRENECMEETVYLLSPADALCSLGWR